MRKKAADISRNAHHKFLSTAQQQETNKKQARDTSILPRWGTAVRDTPNKNKQVASITVDLQISSERWRDQCISVDIGFTELFAIYRLRRNK